MDNYERFFKEHDAPEPPAGLAEAIMHRIEQRERNLLIVKIGVTACVFGISVVLIAIGFGDFRTAIGETGFLQFGSLLFSDFSVTVANLPDFIFSMLEAFPVFSSIIMLVGAGLAVWSTAAMFDELSLAGRRRHSLPH